MSILNKAGFALAALTALGLTASAHAMGGITAIPTVTAPVGAGPFTYSYSVTPTSFNAKQLSFTFSDPNVTYVAGSVTGPLTIVTPTSSGNFFNYNLSGGMLMENTTETIAFTSPDGPFGTLEIAGTGLSRSGNAADGDTFPSVVGPAPVPEASTTASFGLLLALGLGGLAIGARKKSVKA